MDWKETYKSKLVDFAEAVKAVRSGDSIWVAPTTSSPPDLVNALCNRAEELENVNVYSGLLMYPFALLKPNFKGHLNYHTFFLGPIERKFMPHGNVDVISVHFSKIDWMMNNIVKARVLMAEVSLPDERGYMSWGPLGTFCNDLVADNAEVVMVQVNKNVPFVYGEKNVIHVSQVDYICEKDHPLPELPNSPVTEIEKKIAGHILPHIPDGATVQIGLGGIANAVGYGLEDKKDMGVHTEMLTESLVYLAKKGVINCSKKNYYKGKIVCGFGIGNKELYEYMDRNPMVHVAPVYEVNNPYNVAQNDNFISINNALMVDLTGQVCSESLGFEQFSCTGGQLDFVRAAAMSKGGKSFIALSSVVETKNGLQSRIVLQFPPGSVITTPRSDVQYIVTEYGIADLYNKSIARRVHELAKIAHPDFREQLLKDAKEAGLLY